MTLPKRLLLAVLLAVAASIVLVPGASAGNFDEERMGCAGEDPATCATGTVGQPYSLKLYLLGDEDLPCAVFTHASGTLPPGLIISSDEGLLHGTPTQAGNYDFYLNVAYNRETGCQFKNPSDDRFIIPINPGVPPPPKLTIGPESAPVGTVGTAYSLSMTANLPDAKTWSLVAGALPAGLTLNASTGLISGTPTTAGTFPFTVQAVVNPQVTDTKSLTIDVRQPLAITPSEDGPLSEVGVLFRLDLAASGGTQIYTWALATGAIPPGLTFTNGAISGRPTLAGTFSFTVTLTDTEARTAIYRGNLTVAPRLAIPRQKLKTGQIGKLFRTKLRSLGGVGEPLWRIKRGPLPRGIRFDRTTGSFAGRPVKAGTWRVVVEIADELRVKSAATVTLIVKPALKKRK